MIRIEDAHRLTPGGVPARVVVVVDPAGRLAVVKADYELPPPQTVEGFAAYWAKLTGDKVVTA